MWIGSKRNNVKVALRKRITKLINAQAEKDRLALLTISQKKVTHKTSKSRETPKLQFYVPNPKGSTPPLVQVTQQQEKEAPAIQQSRRLNNQQPIQVQSPRGAAAILQNAV